MLSPARYAELADSATIGVGADVPEVLPEGEGAGLVDVEAAEGKAAWRRRLSPRHRDAVRVFTQGN